MNKLAKRKASLKAFSSGILWGSGQVFNKQYIKAVFFAFFQYLLILIELLTGKYFHGGVKHLRDAGIFLKGIWGMITLGERKSGLIEIDRVPYFIEVKGDVSDLLLLESLIAMIILAYFVVIFIVNIMDAYKTSIKISTTGKVEPYKVYIKKIWAKSFPYIVLFPALFLVSLVSIMPIIFGMLVAFTNYNKNHMPPDALIDWVGFKNFINVLRFGGGGLNFAGAFRRVFTWTVIWTIASSATCFFGGFIQALIINNKRVKFTKLWRTFLILPWAVPGMITLLVFQIMFHQFGFVNNFLINTGFIMKPINWFGSEENANLARLMIVILNVWLGYPYFMALLTGVMTSINKELYEAAAIDGASTRQQFWSITFPMVLYMTAPLLIMTVAGNFNNFGVIYFLTGGGPGGSPQDAYAGKTDLLITWIYKLTADPNIRMYNMASVFSIIIFLIIGTVSAWNFTRTKAFKEEDMM